MSKCVIAIDHDDLVAAINALKMVCFEGVSLENAYLCREKDPDLNDAYESLLNVMDIFESVEKVADFDCDHGSFTPRVSKEIANQIYESKGGQAGQVKKELLAAIENQRLGFNSEETIETNSYAISESTDRLRNLSDEDTKKLYDAIFNTNLDDDPCCECEECLSKDEQSHSDDCGEYICPVCGEPISDHSGNEVGLGQLLKNTIVESAEEMLGQINGILLAYEKDPLKEIRFTKSNNGVYVAHIRQ